MENTWWAQWLQQEDGTDPGLRGSLSGWCCGLWCSLERRVGAAADARKLLCVVDGLRFGGKVILIVELAPPPTQGSYYLKSLYRSGHPIQV